MLEVNAPSTETVKARYHLATVPDDIAPDLDRRMRAHNDAEFEAWKEALKEELREEIRRENAAAAPAPKPSSGFPVAPGSVADIYALSPFSPILIEALDHKPGDLTSHDFQRGYFAALAVTHVKGAAALESFGAPEWEYGWRAFFPNGEEYDSQNYYSREEAEFELRENQEHEDANYRTEPTSAGKLTYSLWQRLKSAAGPWERVTDGSDS